LAAAAVKAVLHYRASPGFARKLAALDLDTVIVDEADKRGFARAMAGADILLHVLEPVGAGAIEAAPRLKLIQKIGVGVNTIDLEAARRRNVAVCNMPGTNTQAVAEMTLLLMLATLRRLTQLDRLTRAGTGWTLPLEAIDAQGEISGRTIGLVGFGAVARRLAPVLQALGATVLYTSRRPAADTALRFMPLSDLLAAADIVSLHLPLDDATRHIINEAAFAAMKRGSILVNTARGGLVDPAALRRALESGHLRGAGLDVFDREPAPADDPLLALPNVVVTPHLAWLTEQTLDRSLAVIAENCRRLAAGEALLHRVV
jgi:phosphoglycerate dehydrogenase-like enzyme